MLFLNQLAQPTRHTCLRGHHLHSCAAPGCLRLCAPVVFGEALAGLDLRAEGAQGAEGNESPQHGYSTAAVQLLRHASGAGRVGHRSTLRAISNIENLHTSSRRQSSQT